MAEEDIAKLQEAQMFTDRRTEELHEALLDLSGRIDAVMKRLGALEARVEAMLHVETEPDIRSDNEMDV